MLSITPCQRIISDRFPVASFVVNAPPQRLFEIACATDPTLFHPDQRHRRTAENFFSSRLGGLMRAPAGHATYLMPPEQLRRFAGARRLFYNVGSYAGPSGEDPHFHVEPGSSQAIPSIQISQDFTGKSLDRTRLGGHQARADARYGSAARPEELTWGADFVAAKKARHAAAENAYDDGYSPELWRRSRRLGGEGPGDAGSGTTNGATLPVEEPAGYEDAPDLAAHGGSFAPVTPEPLPISPPAPIPLDGTSPATAQSLRYGGAPPREPPGYEDGAALNRKLGTGGRDANARARAPRLGGGEMPDLPGFEDAPALARGGRAGGGQRRYGTRVAYAAEDAAPSSAVGADTAAGPGSGVMPASTAAPSGRDDDYDDEPVELEEPELPLDSPHNEVTANRASPVPLTIPEKFKLVALVARSEGGAGREAYSKVNADGEYNDPAHGFHHRRHVGLSWGLVQFTQLGGGLGRVLSACQRRDPEQFTQIFGAEAEELLRVTNAETETERLQPVGGHLLWEGPWPERFARAGQIPAFQAAQNEVAIEGYLDPNLPFARFLGWNTDRALALLYDRCVHMGSAGALSWIIRAVGPIRSQRQRSAALAALGFTSLAAFAESVPELGGDVRWTPSLHAALVAALRSQGSASPVALPRLDEQLDALVNAASGRRFAERVRRLRTSTELLDVSYQLLG
jgi:hypothetical protein